jgi:hypothetical protein
MITDDKQLWTLYGQYLGARVIEAVQDGSKLAGLAQPGDNASGFNLLADCLAVYQSVEGLPYFDLTYDAVEAVVLKQDQISNDQLDWLNSWLDAWEAWEEWAFRPDEYADDCSCWEHEHSTLHSAAQF